MSDPTPPVTSPILEDYRPMPVPEWRAPRQRYWLHALLLLATCFTTLVTGARMQYNFEHNRPALSFSDEPIAGESIPFFPVLWIRSHPARLLGGLPFMATLMLFFMAHEMGHYLYCRRYGIYATLPFFIPMPTLIGTMGAVILIRSRIRSRTALFDIGIAGPIAGFVVALAALLLSLGLSKPIYHGAGQPEYLLGYPLIFHLAHGLLRSMNQLHGPAASLPLNQLLLHPTAIAAWVGMLATSLNLLPGGQLDGGHIVYSHIAASPQVCIAADHSYSSADGLLPVDGMVDLGNRALAEPVAPSGSGRVAKSFGCANRHGSIRPVDVGTYPDARTDYAELSTGNRARRQAVGTRAAA